MGNYSSRTFTNPTDKLAALAGLTRDMQSLTNSDCLAGLWRNDLKKDILWYRLTGFKGKTFSVYFALSRSWASINSSIFYDFALLYP
jgi:hypothetical protein